MLSSREYILKYCPSLLLLANLSEVEWEKINARFIERVKHINTTVETNDSITVATTIYEVILRAETGDKPEIAFLAFIEYLCKQILLTVDKIHHPRLRKSAINIVSNFDLERSFYLDPIGEFAALINITQSPSIQLREVELSLPSGKRADFEVFIAKSQKILQIEVLNIHFVDGKIKSEGDLQTFLSKRIEDKLMSKIGTLTINEENKNFALLPVAWCSLYEVIHFPTAFSQVEKLYPLLPFCIVAQQHYYTEERYNYLFATVPELLKRLQK